MAVGWLASIGWLSFRGDLEGPWCYVFRVGKWDEFVGFCVELRGLLIDWVKIYPPSNNAQAICNEHDLGSSARTLLLDRKQEMKR